MAADLPLERLCHCFTPPRAWCRIVAAAPLSVLSSCCHALYYFKTVCLFGVPGNGAHRTCVFCSLFLPSGCRYVVHICCIADAGVDRMEGDFARILHVPWQPSVTRLPSQRCNTVLLLLQAHLSPCRHIAVLEPCPEQAGNRRQGPGWLLRRSNRQRGNAAAVRQCRAAQLHVLQGLRIGSCQAVDVCHEHRHAQPPKHIGWGTGSP